MSDGIEIVIVDDHPLFREGVAHTLGAEVDIKVVGQGETADDAIHLVSTLAPDLVLLDITMPGSGLEAARTISATYPATRVVMVTASEEEDDLVAALKAGARAYVLKGVAARELVGILRAVAAGEVRLPPWLASNILLEMTRPGASSATVTDPLEDLTEREREVLEGVAAGLSNREIALQVHLSEKTVKHYMTSILQKLQVRNRVEAALLARKHAK